MKKIKTDYIYLVIMFFLFYILGNCVLLSNNQGNLIIKK